MQIKLSLIFTLDNEDYLNTLRIKKTGLDMPKAS